MFQNQNPWVVSRKEFSAVVDCLSQHVVRLLYDDDSFATGFPGIGLVKNDDFAVVCNKQSIKDIWWTTKRCTYLVALKDGHRKLLSDDALDVKYFFSPGNKYLCWFEKGKYFSFSLSTNIVRNIVENIPVPLDDEATRKYGSNSPHTEPVGICGWVDDETLLIYDDYDIWRVDLRNEEKSINITKGFGRRNNIKLRMIDDTKSVVSLSGHVVLSAFNTLTKESGFYSKWMNRVQDPKLLTLVPSAYVVPSQEPTTGNMLVPSKAVNANTWVVSSE